MRGQQEIEMKEVEKTLGALDTFIRYNFRFRALDQIYRDNCRYYIQLKKNTLRGIHGLMPKLPKLPKL